jgi:hypothetical protein
VNVYAVVDDSLSPASPLGESIEVFVRREDAERLVEEVRGDDPDQADHLRIEERERVYRVTPRAEGSFLKRGSVVPIVTRPTPPSGIGGAAVDGGLARRRGPLPLNRLQPCLTFPLVLLHEHSAELGQRVRNGHRREPKAAARGPRSLAPRCQSRARVPFRAGFAWARRRAERAPERPGRESGGWRAS